MSRPKWTDTKRCSHCREVKLRAEFHKAGNGHQQWCKVCRSLRSRAGLGPGRVQPRPMPNLPDRVHSEGCGVCGQRLRFNTDATSALTQECYCGVRLVPLRGLIHRSYDSGLRLTQDLTQQVARAQTPALPSYSHPTENTHRTHLNTRTDRD